jgi:glycosyl-4,4'-diaponeurosporenoate acyltransferase
MATVASTHHAILAGIDAAVWAVWSATCGFVGHRLPAGLLPGGRRRPPRAAGRPGRGYERVLRIKAWKDLLPEAGALYRGGFSKRRIVGHDRAYLERFAIETRRAELVHWAILALGPAFFAWNPWWLATAMVAYAVIANVPCLLVQRYNRARLARILAPAAPDAAHPLLTEP